MEILIFGDRRKGQNILAEAMLRHYYADDDVTFIDVSTLEDSDIDDEIDELGDNTYDKIHVLCQIGPADYCVSYAQMGKLLIKIKATVIATLTEESSGTCQANVTGTEIVLAAAEDEANDYYNDMYIITDGTTEVSRLITDYVGATDTCTVADTDTAITTTEDYQIFDADQVETVIVPYYVNLKEAEFVAPVVFAALWPNAAAPLVVEQMGTFPGEPCLQIEDVDDWDRDNGVFQITGGEAAFEDGAYDDGTWYLGLSYSAEGGESGEVYGEVLRIESNDDTTVYLADKPTHWEKISAAKQLDIEIADRKSIPLARHHLELAFRSVYPEPDKEEQMEGIMYLLSKGEDITSSTTRIYQDLDAVEAFKENGKIVMMALGAGIEGIETEEIL